jgi:hypothetical protein
MYLEYSTNNAVLVTFVTLLTQSLHANKQQTRRQGVELTTPTGLHSIQNHDRDTEKMVFARNGSQEAEGDPGESEGQEEEAEGLLNSRNGELDRCGRTDLPSPGKEMRAEKVMVGSEGEGKGKEREGGKEGERGRKGEGRRKGRGRRQERRKGREGKGAIGGRGLRSMILFPRLYYPGPSSPSLQRIKSRRAYNRWLVAYTLLRNPGLRHLTSSGMRGQEIAARGRSCVNS